MKNIHEDSGVFQQDNELCHAPQTIPKKIFAVCKRFKVMTWPPNYPDLNPVEHLCDVLNK